MKKLFYLLSVALVFMATSCKNESYIDEFSGDADNDGKDNPIFTYYSATQNLCGSSIATVDQKLKDLGMTAVDANKYQLVGKEYVVTIDYADVDKNESIDILNVTFTPAEQKHDAVLTFECIKQFSTAVGNNMKLFATSTACRYYGFYSAEGKWLGAMGDVKSFYGSDAATDKSISGGYAFWLDESIKDYDPSLKAPNEFTGMYLNPTASKTEGEYDIVLSFVMKQTLSL